MNTTLTVLTNDKRKELTLLESQYNHFRRVRMKGIESTEALTREFNQINNAIGLSRSINDLSGAVFGYYSIGKIYFEANGPSPTHALANLFHAKALQLGSGQRTHRMLPKIQEAIGQVMEGKSFNENRGLVNEAYQLLPEEVRKMVSQESLLD